MIGWTTNLYAVSVAVMTMTFIGIPATTALYLFLEFRLEEAFYMLALASAVFFFGSFVLTQASLPNLYFKAGVVGAVSGVAATVLFVEPVRKTYSTGEQAAATDQE